MNQCQRSIVILFSTVLIGSLLLVAPAAAEETNSTDSTIADVSIEVEEISDSEYRLTYEISPGDGTHFVSPPDDQIPIESMENLERTSQPGVLRITDVSEPASLVLRVDFDALGRYGGSTRDSAVFESNVDLYSNGEWTPIEYTGVEGLSVSVSGEDGLETHLGRGSIYVGDNLVVESTELPDGRQVTIVGTERQLGDGEIVNHALSRLSAINQMVNLTTEYDITVAVSSGVSRAYVPYSSSGDTVWPGTMFVSPSDVTNGHTLAHEYIHLQQEMHFSSEMEWIVEGSAEYFATQTMQNQDGVESYFESDLEPGSESEDILANRDSWDNQWVEYEKGAIVAMLLDYQLQQHGSSLEEVMREINRRNFSEPVTYDEFHQIIVDRTDLTVGYHLDRWVQEPDTFHVPDSAYRFLLTQHAENHVESSGDLSPETPMILNIDGRLSPSELVLTGHQRVYDRHVKSDTDEGGKKAIAL